MCIYYAHNDDHSCLYCQYTVSYHRYYHRHKAWGVISIYNIVSSINTQIPQYSTLHVMLVGCFLMPFFVEPNKYNVVVARISLRSISRGR